MEQWKGLHTTAVNHGKQCGVKDSPGWGPLRSTSPPHPRGRSTTGDRGGWGSVDRGSDWHAGVQAYPQLHRNTAC